jgi:hypothetical protein
MVAQADLARATSRGREVTDREVAQVVVRISEPEAPERGRSKPNPSIEQSL